MLELGVNKEVSLNVAVIPSKDVLKESIRLSNEISKTLGTVITLNKKTSVPHISIYQAHYPSSNVEEIKKVVKEIAENTMRFSLELNDFSLVLDTYIFWNCVRNQKLQKLHNQIVEKLNHLRGGLVLPHLARVTGMGREDIKDIQKYGNIFIGERYRPHITLSRLFQKQKPDELFDLISKGENVHFTVDSLVLGKVGGGGTLMKIVERFPFKI